MLQDNVKFQFYCSIERKKNNKNIRHDQKHQFVSTLYSKIDKKVV